MNAVKDDVLLLVEKELAFANTKFPPFSSTHEGYAVLKEEYEECFDEIVNARGNLGLLWQATKNNTSPAQAIIMFKATAVNLAVEAIQLAAMCDKYDNSLGLVHSINEVLDRERERISNGTNNRTDNSTTGNTGCSAPVNVRAE